MDGINMGVICCGVIDMKQKPKLKIQEPSFGRRMAKIRKSRGLTQKEFAKRIGISSRMVAYYEVQSEHIPAHLLPSIARSLQVSTDELLGVKRLKLDDGDESVRLLKKLRMVSKLPRRQRKAVLDYADALLSKQNNSH